MSYNTKKLFTKAISNVTKEFGSLNFPENRDRRKTGRPPIEESYPDDILRGGKGVKSDRTIKQRIKDAFLEAGSQDYMEAYTNTLNILNSAQRNRPRFSKIGIGVSKPTMAKGSTFGAISESDPEKLLKENRARMKDFVISKAYLKA